MLQPTGISLPAVQEPGGESNPDEKSEKSVTSAHPESTSTLNDITAVVKPKLDEIAAVVKPKLEEAQQFFNDVLEHIEKSPTKYQFVLMGFLFVALSVLMYAILAGGAAPAVSVDPILEPIETEVVEEMTEPKNKLLKAATKTLLKLRKRKGDEIEA